MEMELRKSETVEYDAFFSAEELRTKPPPTAAIKRTATKRFDYTPTPEPAAPRPKAKKVILKRKANGALTPATVEPVTKEQYIEAIRHVGALYEALAEEDQVRARLALLRTFGGYHCPCGRDLSCRTSAEKKKRR
jgi:hypothetical protein